MTLILDHVKHNRINKVTDSALSLVLFDICIDTTIDITSRLIYSILFPILKGSHTYNTHSLMVIVGYR